MRLEPVMTALRSGLASHLGVAANDPQVEAAGEHLMEALGPGLRTALIDLAQQAAAEVDAQLSDHVVSVVLTGQDVELRVDEQASPTVVSEEELDARITLRLPPSLKSTIERFATVDGESVNSWVIDALSKRAGRSGSVGSRHTEEFDL